MSNLSALHAMAVATTVGDLGSEEATGMGANDSLAAPELDELLRAHHRDMLQPTEDEDVTRAARHIFDLLCDEARALQQGSPLEQDPPLVEPLRSLADLSVLRHSGLCEAIGSALASKLTRGCGCELLAGDAASSLRNMMVERIKAPFLLRALLADLSKAWVADPAAQSLFHILFLLKGFQALATYRVAHKLWTEGGVAHKSLALWLQSRASEVFGACPKPCEPPCCAPRVRRPTPTAAAGRALSGRPLPCAQASTYILRPA